MHRGHELAMLLRKAYLAFHRRANARIVRSGVTADQFVLLTMLARGGRDHADHDCGAHHLGPEYGHRHVAAARASWADPSRGPFRGWAGTASFLQAREKRCRGDSRRKQMCCWRSCGSPSMRRRGRRCSRRCGRSMTASPSSLSQSRVATAAPSKRRRTTAFLFALIGRPQNKAC